MIKDEKERLRVLEEFGLNYSEKSPNFDRITHIAALHFKMPISFLSFIGKDTQWFKSTFGMDLQSTPRGVAFCNDTIAGDDLHVVRDARKDSRYRDNPLVLGSPHIRFYAGAPIVYQPGVRVGSVCVVDTLPRSFNQDDGHMLTFLAELVVTELRLIKATRLLRKAFEKGVL